LSLLGLVLMTMRRRAGGPVFAEEWTVLGVWFGFTVVQHLTQGQPSMDDWCFTPLYLAVPMWYGHTRGTAAGLIVGALGALAMLTAAVCFGPSGASGAAIPLQEYMLLAVVLAGAGALAGTVAREHPGLPYLPLAWVAVAAVLQRDLLFDVAHYGQAAFAATVLAGLEILSLRRAESVA